MRKLGILLLTVFVTACGGGGGDGPDVPQAGTSACSNDGQKQFVLDNLYAWFLWNDLLPANINIADYASPEELAVEVTRTFGPQNANGGPLDRFTGVGSLQADQEFFEEGKFEGFGFSWRFTDQAQTEFTIIRTFAGSPADQGGLARGRRVLSLNSRSIADIAANEGINVFFDAFDTIDFEIQPPEGSTFVATISKDVVTIDPVPQVRIIDAGNGRKVGYLELATFISTAEEPFDEAFKAFNNAAVSEVILDLRYNGGGLVNVADLLGNYLGGFVSNGLVFSNTEYNADRADNNGSTLFSDIAGRSLNLSQLVVIASRGTASASELVTNGMIPHVNVGIVGDRTFGKPVGQVGLSFCNKILRPTSFRVANALGAGDYFDGLPVDCAAADDLTVAVGDDLDPNIIAAMSFIETGACPVVALPGGVQKLTPDLQLPETDRNADRNMAPHRELLDAY
jgi:C-terminal processing protease CtpA/Prc